MELERGLSVKHAASAIDLAAGRPSPFLVIALVLRALGTSVLAALPDAAPRLAADARGFEAEALNKIKPDGIRMLAVMNLKRRPTYRVGRD